MKYYVVLFWAGIAILAMQNIIAIYTIFFSDKKTKTKAATKVKARK